MMESIIRPSVWGFHIYALIVCLISETPMHSALFVEGDYSCLWVLLPFVLTLYFYYKVCQGPGFVEADTSALIEGDNNYWFCNECHLSPPIRSGHCKTCKRCVLRRDHHCPWMGTCIGMDNHLFFLFFLALEVFDFSFLIKQSYKVALSTPPLSQWLLKNFQCGIVCGISVFGMIQPIILLPAHICFALINVTTWEIVKGDSITYIKQWNHNFGPFSRGILSNIAEFVTMRWKHPVYRVPSTEEEIAKWKDGNFFLENDYYNCC